MVLLPPDYHLSPIPAYGWATSLTAIIQGLGQLSSVAPSHIVVVDDQGHPLGAIALVRLWASHIAAGTLGDMAQLLDCQPWLEPVVTVMSPPPLEGSELLQLRIKTGGDRPPTLVAVDADGRYRGVLHPSPVLGQVLPSAAAPALLPSPGPQQRAWIMELSHALKTPMTTLLGLSTLLLDSRVGSLSDRQFRYVSLMRQAIRRLTNLVNLLLDWMRLDSEQIAITREQIGLQALVDDLLPSFLNAQPDARRGTWVEDFSLELTPPEAWLMADPLRLRQSLHYSLSYLLGHGALPSGLVVEQWGQWLSITLWSATPMAPPTHFLGMTEGLAPTAGEDLGHRQPDNLSSIPPFAGPQSIEALGLTLARRLSQLHGGELNLVNSSAQGCRLTILLPAPDPPVDRDPVLLLLACGHGAVIDQVYQSLRGSPYRFVLAPSCEALADYQQRLTPRCTLVHWDSLVDAPTEAKARAALLQRLDISGAVVLGAATHSDRLSYNQAAISPLSLNALGLELRLLLDRLCLDSAAIAEEIALPPGGLTILLLPGEGQGALPEAVKAGLEQYRCRLLQVDDLPQASLLSRVWQIEAVILEGAEPVSSAYLRALIQEPDLVGLAVVTLAPLAPGVAALAPGVIACPELLSQPPNQAVESLLRAILGSKPRAKTLL